MTSMVGLSIDLQRVVDAREPSPRTSLEICQLGLVETGGGREQMMLLKFVEEGGVETFTGVFVPEMDEGKFGEWVSRGAFDSVVFSQLEEVKRVRLKQFSSLNLSPAIIFNLALNTDLSFEDVRDNYPPYGVGKLEPVLAIASEESWQGKTFLVATQSLRWGDIAMSGDMFTADNVERLMQALRESGWGREMEPVAELELFRKLRTGGKLPGQSFKQFQDELWSHRCKTPGLLLVDLPGMKKNNGVDTRPTNGFDVQRWAMPTFVIPPNQKPQGKEFDEDHARKVTEGFYKAIRDTWHLDEQRVAGLRKLLN